MTIDIALRFGHGGAEPYERAIEKGSGALRLVDANDELAVMSTAIDISRFARDASAEDVDALSRTNGAVLDVGCGPARIVHAAIRAGRLALGIDLSPAAVAFAQDRGLPVLRRSVFQSVPSAGSWGTVALLDGNIGIGGSPRRLLYRCRDLMDPNGSVLVETHPDAEREAAFEAVLLDSSDMRSSPFPWAEVGAAALLRAADDTGFAVEAAWESGGRHFSILTRR